MSDTTEFRHAVFAIDALPEGLFSGFTAGGSWNGWAVPLFTWEVADCIADAFPPGTGSYDEGADSFVFRNPEEPEDVEEFRGTDICVDGRAFHVYPVGACSWTWDEAGGE